MINVCIMNLEKLKDMDIDRVISSLQFGEAEKKRLMSIKNRSRRLQSIGALLCLEELLKIQQLPPMDILRTDNGKPYFVGNTSPSFSLTHTDCHCAAALLDDCENIGIDMESNDRVLDLEGMSNRFFTDDEKAVFDNNGKTKKAFLAIWTAKEARAKLFGDGVFTIQEHNIPIYTYTQALDIEQRTLILSVAATKATKIKIFTEKDAYELQNRT